MASGLTPIYFIPYPLSTDPVDVHGDIQDLALQLEDVLFLKPDKNVANVFTQQNLFNVNSSSDAVRINQTGTGNAFVVEDSANPDTSPFVIDASGNVGIGKTVPTLKLDVTGAGAFSSTLTASTFNALTLTSAAVGFTIAGGTTSKTLTINNTIALSGTDSTVMTFPSTSQTIAGLAVTSQVFTTAQTFRAANSVRSEAAATQDAIILAGRAGGTGSFGLTLTPTTLASSKTVTFQDVTGTVYVSTGTDVTLADGGTNASLTAANGGIVYSNATGLAISAVGSAGQMLQSNGAAIPTWSTATFPSTATTTGTILRSNGTNWVATTTTYPTTTTANQILYSSAGNVIGEISTANNQVLVTGGTGIPAFSGTLPTGVTASSLTSFGTSPTLVTPKIDVINTNTGVTTAAALWGDITTGTITAGNGLTTGSITLGGASISGGSVVLAPTALASTVTISGTAVTTAVAKTVNIATGASTLGTTTVNIANNASAGSVVNIGLGSTAGTSTITVLGTINLPTSTTKIGNTSLIQGGTVNITFPTLAGTLVGTGDSGTITTAMLANSSSTTTGVTYAKMQFVSTQYNILGRISASAGIVEELTPNNIVTVLAQSTTRTGGTTNIVFDSSPTIVTPIIDILNATSATSTTANLYNNVTTGTAGILNQAAFNGILNIASGAGTVNKTINIGALSTAGTTAVTIGSSSGATSTITLNGTVSTSSNLTVGGNLTVNGTTTTINSTVVNVDDILIELGAVTTPTDLTAEGGGISLLGATNKTITWSTTGNNWTSSENWNLLTSKVYKINNVEILSSTRVLGLTPTINASGYTLSGGTTAVAVTFAGGAAYTLSGTNGQTYTFPTAGGTLVSNPMTTLGDLTYGGASGLPTRLAGNATSGIYFLRENVTASASVAPDWIGSTGSGNVVLATAPSIAGGTHTALTSLGIRDTSAAFDVTIAATSSTALTAGRTLTLDLVNAARTIKLQGNLDIGANLTTVGTFSTAATFSTAGAFSTAAAFTQAGAFATTITSTAISNATLPAGTTTLAANVTTTIGDLIYASATGTPGTLSRLAGNIAVQPSFLSSFGNATSNTTTQFVTSTGSGSVVLSTSPSIAGGTHTALTSLGIRDTSAAFDITIAAASSTALTAGRTLTLDLINAARTIKLAGNIDIANNLTTAGNFALTLTTTNTTNATIPAGTITLVDLATSQALTNKTISGLTVSTTTGTLTIPAATVVHAGAFATTITATAITNATLPAGTTTLAANVTTTIGDVIFASATGTPGTLARLAGNILAQPAFLTSTGNGSANTTTTFTASTGSGNVVLSTSPALTTPSLGVASATSINRVTLTAPATGSTLTIIDGKTLTVNNTIILSAANDSSTLNISTGGTLGTAAFTAASAYEPTITTLAISKGGTGTGTAPTQYGVIYATSTTAFASTAAGTNAQVLIGNAAGAPSWTNISGLSVSTAVNLSGTTVNSIPYQSASGTTSYIAIGTANQVLTVNGTANGYTWTAPFTNPMTTLGDMVYGGASGVSTRLPNAGTTNGTYILQETVAGGVAAAPSWLVSTGTGNNVLATSPTITTPVIDSISASAATGINPSLYANTTTGNISLAAGLTTGQLNIAAVGTGITPITIGHTNATIALNGVVTTSTDVIVGGNLTVNGTTTTINSTVVNVDDILIELGAVAVPTDATANGGGISLLGATNKTIIWDVTNNNWTSSENWNIASGKVFKIANTQVLSTTAVLGITPTINAIGFSLAGGTTSKSLTLQNTLTLAGTDSSTLNIGGGGTLGSAAFTASTAYISSTLMTTIGDVIYGGTSGVATRLAGNIAVQPSFLTSTGNGSANTTTSFTSSTGSGNVVLATSPSLTTPTLGVASATSINKVNITAPATGSTLTIIDGKTLTVNNTLTLSGTDSSTLNIGTGGTLGTGAFATIANYAPLAGATFTGQIQSTLANDAATGGGQIYLNGATGNRIDFNASGVAAPTFTTRSAGTKIVLWPGITAIAVDYALGIDGNTFWSSVVNPSASFKWYAGTTNIATLTGAGALTTTGSVTASSIIRSGGLSTQYLMADGSVTSGVAAGAGSLTGTTLAANVINSSLTALGTLSALTVTGTTVLNGALTVNGTVTVPTPTNPTHATNKAYVDSVLAAGVPAIIPLDNISNQFNDISSRFLPTYQGKVQSIGNPLRLLLTINGIIQYVDFPEYVWQSPLPREGFQVDNDGYLAFSEAVPAGSRFDARIMPGPNTQAERRQVSFTAVDILLGG